MIRFSWLCGFSWRRGRGAAAGWECRGRLRSSWQQRVLTGHEEGWIRQVNPVGSSGQCRDFDFPVESSGEAAEGFGAE